MSIPKMQVHVTQFHSKLSLMLFLFSFFTVHTMYSTPLKCKASKLHIAMLGAVNFLSPSFSMNFSWRCYDTWPLVHSWGRLIPGFSICFSYEKKIPLIQTSEKADEITSAFML